MTRHLSSSTPFPLPAADAGRRLSARSPVVVAALPVAARPAAVYGDGGGRVEPPGLGGPRTRRSTATIGMASAAAAGGGEEERQREGALPCVLGLPVALPLPVAISRLDAGVPRKARTGRPLPRPKPSGWWAFRLPVPLPEKAKKPPEKARLPAAPEKAGSPRPKRQRVCLQAPSPPDLDAATAPDMEKPAKKARRCLQCGSADTPQWRSGPMGRSTLCNACGVRLRAAGALRETELSPPTPTAKKAVQTPPPPPPESPASDSSSDSPIWQRQAPLEDIYLVRKPPQRERRPPRRESPPAPSPVVYLVKKKKPSKKPWRPRNTGQKCQHCGTTSTPQWREGPTGRHTLCNACGVRYRQGRLLPEYRPAASPTFVASEHASRHRDVLQLHRQQQQQQSKNQHPKQRQPVDDDKRADTPGSDSDDKNNVFLMRRQQPLKEYPPTPLHRPLLQQPVEDDDPRDGGNKDSAAGTVAAGHGGGDGATDAPDAPDALDSLLLGPSAPLIADGDDFMVR